MKPFFHWTKYCSRKQGKCATIHYSLFAINFCGNIFATENFFFLTKNSFVFVKETATSTQILRIVYCKKPIRETWRTTYYTLFAVRCFLDILLLFRCCLQIVYGGLYHCNVSYLTFGDSYRKTVLSQSALYILLYSEVCMQGVPCAHTLSN